jgi:hypothetical protein
MNPTLKERVMPNIDEQKYTGISNDIRGTLDERSRRPRRRFPAVAMICLCCFIVLLLQTSAVPQQGGSYTNVDNMMRDQRDLIWYEAMYEHTHDPFFAKAAQNIRDRISQQTCFPSSSQCTDNSQCCSGNCQRFGQVRICN